MSPSDMTNNKRKAEDDDDEEDSFDYYKRILMAGLDSESEQTNDNLFLNWFLCSTCKRWFKSERELVTHYWKMPGQNVYPSNIEEFSDNEHSVKQPEDENDDDERESSFDYYKRILMAGLDSESEQKNDSQFLKWFLCSTCKRWFNSERELVTHYWKMHGQNVSLSNIKEFSDNEHPIKKPVKKSAKKLVRSCLGDVCPVVSDQKVVFNCDVCLEVCASALKLLVHKRLHIGRARMNCAICGITFEKRGHLLKHVKMKHSDQVARFTKLSIPPVPTTTFSTVTAPSYAISFTKMLTTTCQTAILSTVLF